MNKTYKYVNNKLWSVAATVHYDVGCIFTVPCTTLLSTTHNWLNLHPNYASFMNSSKTEVFEPRIPKKPGLIQRFKNKYDFREIVKAEKQKRDMYKSYEKLSDEIPVLDFFKEFNMEDSFYSWFLVIELHVWIISARVMKDQKRGDFLRDIVISAMWNDTMFRIAQLSEVSSLKRNKDARVLSDQFNLAIIGYDEGVQSNDMVLAGAIWRRFFCYDCDDMIKIERLVKYIRKQFQHMSTISIDDIMLKKKKYFIPLSEIKI